MWGRTPGEVVLAASGAVESDTAAPAELGEAGSSPVFFFLEKSAFAPALARCVSDLRFGFSGASIDKSAAVGCGSVGASADKSAAVGTGDAAAGSARNADSSGKTWSGWGG